MFPPEKAEYLLEYHTENMLSLSPFKFLFGMIIDIANDNYSMPFLKIMQGKKEGREKRFIRKT